MRIAYLFLIINNIALAEQLPDLNQFFKNDHELKSIIGYDETNEFKGKNMPLDQAESLGVSNRDNENSKECDKSNCNVNQIFGADATLKRQEKTEEVGFIRDKDGNVKNNKGFFDKALKQVKNADKEFDYLNGSYIDCPPTEEITKIKTEEICDQYYDMQTSSCMPRQIVEIDPRYNYLCNKKREVKEKICSDVIKSIKCKKIVGCSAGGLYTEQSNNELMQSSGGLRLRSSPQGDATIILELGNDRHWTYDVGQHGCAMKEFTAKFYIKHLSQISTFRLFEIFENNLVHIAVNGVTVYNGLGGNDLALGIGAGINQIVWSGTGRQGSCGVNAGHTHWKAHNYDMLGALILREGENNIHIKLVYHWYGHAGFKIIANSHCCTEFDITREEKCEYR